MKQQHSTFIPDAISHRISLAAGGGVVGLGLLVLGSWLFDIASPKWLMWAPMIPNNALCFILTGGALCLLQVGSTSPWKNIIARGCAGVVILIGLLSLIEQLADTSLGIDNLLFKISLASPNGLEGRMAVSMALNFMMLGTALLLLKKGRPLVMRTLIIAVGISSYLALLNRILGGDHFYGIIQITTMAWHTSPAFLLLCAGVAAASNDAGILVLLGSKRVNVFVRRLLPAAVFVPLIIAWLRILGQRKGLYGTEFGIGLLVVSNTVIFIALIWWSSQTFHKLNASREIIEAECEHERFLLRSLMDHVPDRIYFKDAQSRFLRINPALSKLFHLTDPTQAIGKCDFDFFTEEHARQALEDEQRVMKTGQPITMEEMETWLDGRVTWVLSSKIPLRDTHGHIIGTFGISHDITAKKQRERELQLMSNRLMLATRAAAIGIWDFDPVNNQLVWDEQMFRVFGVKPDQFSGTYEAWQASVHPDDLPQEMEKVQIALQGGQEFDSEFRVIWPDQSIHYIKANAMVQRDATGKALRMIGTNWDITEQKNSEQKLANAYSDLARSNADLAQFASVASHDLQEPLRAVAGCVELLAKDYSEKLDDDADVLIQHILDGTKRMQTLIGDLLEYSRVNTKGKPAESTDANAALNAALANLVITLREREVMITRDPLPTVLADSTQLTQIFQNLIANGVKFCMAQRPEIHIGAECKNGCWIFSVRDNGIGIEPQYLERIFILFQRLHTRTEYPGTGIGLSICKRIVERHHGRIWVESELGKGSTFFFTLSEPPKQTS